MRVLCVANQKGGVGKTSTAVNLAASLAAMERKVLLIDLDPQGNATSYLGVDREESEENNVYYSLIGESEFQGLILGSRFPNLSIIPAGPDLAGAEIELVGMARRETRLRKALYGHNIPYDPVIIDCPPSLGLLTVNALTASDAVIVPLQCEYLAMEGLGRLLGTVERVQESLNPSLSIEGILLTMFDGRNNLSRQVEAEIRSHLGEMVFTTVIPRNVRISESPSFGKPVLMYAYSSKGAMRYVEFARELLSRWNEGERK